MADFEFNFTNYTDKLNRLNDCVKKVDQAVEISAKYFVTTGVTEIKKRASGRPGPNVISDILRSGYQGDVVERQLVYAKAHIWNPVFYAPYVEFMQNGKYAHYRPGIKVAIEMTEDFYKEQLEAAMK